MVKKKKKKGFFCFILKCKGCVTQMDSREAPTIRGL